jgi:hypothetical protein
VVIPEGAGGTSWPAATEVNAVFDEHTRSSGKSDGQGADVFFEVEPVHRAFLDARITDFCLIAGVFEILGANLAADVVPCVNGNLTAVVSRLSLCDIADVVCFLTARAIIAGTTRT